MGRTSTVYLLHLDRPLSHARHYLGSTADLEARLEEHRRGTGARLMEVCKERGIGFTLARTWAGGRTLERQLKQQKGGPRLCPICLDHHSIFGGPKVTTLLQRSEGTEAEAGEFSLAKHNGHVTLTSPVTGRHLVFLIQTVTRGSWEGRRVVSLKTSDGGLVWRRAFGEVVDGQVKVWSKYRDDAERPYRRYADLLNRADYWAGRLVRYQVEARCRVCNRLLVDPTSLSRGTGPECAKKS
jgi:predicted GIY-YIG superfamily endonuclease